MAYQWAQWGRQKDYMMHYYGEREYYFNKIGVPLFSLSFPNDHFAPKEAVDWLTDQFANGQTTRFHFPPTGPQPKHFDYFRQQFKDQLWIMTNDWITKK